VLAAVLWAASPEGIAPLSGGGALWPGPFSFGAGESGLVGLGLAVRRLPTTASLLDITAHPDDENSGVHARLNRGQGVRTMLLTATRGTGGQNEIGPELFESLGVLRTEELAAVHRFDGTEQYFARAIDFGYSFSVDETFEQWGREEILDDFVRIIRTVRPDVVITMNPDGEGGGQHHQATARLAGEAFRAAADPAQFPHHLRDGLRPWQPRKLYYSLGFARRAAAGLRATEVRTDVYDPLLGGTYAEIGSEARSQHKCQGMAQLITLPGPAAASYRLADSSIATPADGTESSLFDGVETRIENLAVFAGPRPPDRLTTGLAEVAKPADAAGAAFAAGDAPGVLASVLSGLRAVRAIIASLPGLGLDETAAYEIGFRLRQKARDFEQAAVQAQALRVDVLADDGVIVPGQKARVTVLVANRGAGPIRINGAALAGFDSAAPCDAGEVVPGGVYRCERDVTVPAAAAETTPYWTPVPGTGRYVFQSDAPFGLPFRPTPFRAALALSIGGTDVPIDRPVLHRYEGNIFSGEKRMELHVVPAFSVRMRSDIAIFPVGEGMGRPSREIQVVVTSGAKTAARGEVTLELPSGWTASPTSAPVVFSHEDEAATVRFAVSPPAGIQPGEWKARAVVRDGTYRAGRGYESIEYPHTARRHRIVPAETRLKAIDVRVARGLRVGYVMGVGDQVPPAIVQLGADVEFLGPDDLASKDLSGYDAIVTGVRAYERRPDLRAYNHRLLAYADGGGTVLVQYNKFEFNEAQYGPFPAKVSSNRVTSETAPVEVLVPGHPVFSWPNAIGEAAWRGWVQERGLYFLGEKDSRYTDLVRLEDPFPFNRGPKLGALVEARVGRGRWVYVGLGLWRQLPAGSEGAYTLLANLLSVGRAPSSR
jgi:LmbE family N-acetylglucosaminyl deacetylase